MNNEKRKNIWYLLVERIHDSHGASWPELSFVRKLLASEIPPEYHEVILCELRAKFDAIPDCDASLRLVVAKAIEEVEKQMAEAEEHKAEQANQVTDADRVVAVKQAVQNISKHVGSGGADKVSAVTELALGILGICHADTKDGVQQSLKLTE